MKRIIIVGGGPAGSLLAIHLARSGVEALVLERSHFPRDKACGEFISPLGVKCLSDVGLLEAALEAGGQWIDRARMVLPSRAGIEGPLSRHAARNKAKTLDTQKGLTLPRCDLDSLLLAEAERAGAEVRQGFRVSDLQRDDRTGTWQVSGRDRDCGPLTFEGDAIIGADGAGSVVARRMDWLRPAWPQRMGITASFRGMESEPGVIEMHMLADGYCGVVRQADGVTHVGMAFQHRKGELPGGNALEPYLHDALRRFPGLRERLDGVELSGPVKAFGPMAVCSKRRAGEGVLLVGDAAGFLDPVTGHGIGFAMRSAGLAAETLIEAASANDFSARRLEAYSRAYDREFRPVLRLYGGIQKVLSLPQPVLNLMGVWLDAHPGPIRALIPHLFSHAESPRGPRHNVDVLPRLSEGTGRKITSCPTVRKFLGGNGEI